MDGDAMKSLLAKIAIHKAVGLYLGEHEVSVCKVAAMPFGTVELASSTEPYEPDDLPDVLERLLGPLLGRRRRCPLAVGLPSSRLFFGTRLATGGAETPQAMLQKVLCSSNIRVDDLTVDLLRGEVHKAPVASVAACRKKYLTGVVATLGRLGVRPFRAEPSPYALIRLAAKRHPAPRRSKTVLRVFLGATQGLAALVAGGLPLAWRTFTLPAGAEGSAILSVARALRTQERHYGIESSPDYAMIHGRADLHERLQQEEFATGMGTRVLWHGEPAFDGASMAMGLALGCLEPNGRAFDLSRSLKSRASIGDIFPWGDLAFTSALVLCMGLVLGVYAMKLDESYARVQAKSSQHKCLASADLGRLQKETEDVKQKVQAVRTFLDSRILWSAYAHDISTRLPANAVLIAFDAQCGLEGGGKGAPKKSLKLRATAPFGQGGMTPRDIDAFLVALRNDRLLTRDFPSVELTDISRAQTRGKEASGAGFTIVCLPNAKGAASLPQGGAGGKKGPK
jgi:hypothetical protein